MCFSWIASEVVKGARETAVGKERLMQWPAGEEPNKQTNQKEESIKGRRCMPEPTSQVSSKCPLPAAQITGLQGRPCCQGKAMTEKCGMDSKGFFSEKAK